MSNLVHALNLATDLASFMFPARSDNRRTDGGEFNEAYITRNDVTQKITGLRNSHPIKEGASRSDVVTYGAKVLRAGVGNCFDFSCAGAYLLEKRFDVSTWDVVQYKPEGDHMFLAIGYCGGFDKDFANWPDTCAIFDGWAQIACMAKNYKPKWSAKMNEWAASTPKIELPGPKGGKFGSATAWRDVINWQKASYLG